MIEKNTAVIISNHADFGAKWEAYLKSNNYFPKHVGRLQRWDALEIDISTNCCVIDNVDGNFPFADFFQSLSISFTQLFLINVGNSLPDNLKAPYIIFNVDPSSESIPLANFLKYSELVLRHEKVRTELVSMLLHDVRSPLNSLIGYLELLLNDVFGALNEGQKNILEKAMEMGDATLDMMEDLNEAFRGEQNAFALQKEPFNFSEILESVLVNIWVKADRKNIKIKKEIDAKLDKITGDDYQIQRVLANLLNNAIKYSPDNSQITIQASPNPDNCAQISIIDNGQGVPEKQLKHLFDKYYRVKNQRQVEKGYGLGLYISKNIIRTHRGKIWAQNNALGGLTVTFTLPLT
jgi:signal transduction histidine kinase